jgi:hypothetical protein
MKKIIVVLISLVFMFITVTPAISKDHRSNTQKRSHQSYKQHSQQRHYHYNKHQNYKGYRNNPYGNRHYDRRSFYGNHYKYYGHWNSWNHWSRYIERYPHIRNHGSYYKEGSHLMFRFCDPTTGNCFFFSIGR